MNEERYAVARMAALYGAAKTAYPTTLIAGLLLVGMLWGTVDTALLFAWFGALVVVTLLRIGQHAGYERDPSRRPARDWEFRFGIGAFVAGLLWMLPPIAMFPPDDPLRQMAIVFVGGGSVIGAAGIYASSPLAFYAFCLPPTLAVAARLGLAYGASFPFISGLMVVFAVAMIQIGRAHV